MKSEQSSKFLNVVLWIAQILLAVTFVWAGAMKIFDSASLPWAWIKENALLVKLTGVLDILAGVGLVLPALLRIQPRLTIFAAYGTIALMVTAIVFHVSRNEASQIGFNIFVLLTASFIVWGREKKAPIQAK